MLPNLDPAELPPDAVEVGRIADAWGVKGWFKVSPYSAAPEALFSSKRWFIQPSERGGSAFTGTLKLPISEAREHSDAVVASSTEIRDRNQAEALRGCRIYVPRSSFPTAGADEYYWVDLMGLQVLNREGVGLGVVRDLMSTGPQTVLVLEYEVQDAQGAVATASRMIPFVSAYVDKVDLADRRITVDWQPDY